MIRNRAFSALVLAGVAVSHNTTVHLYLLRHGQATSNLWPMQGPMGNLDGYDPKLTEIGRQQANSTGPCLAENMSRPDFVFASCLVRAQETALLAYPHQQVHIVPHTCEEHWGTPWLHPASVPSGIANQQHVVAEDLPVGASDRQDFTWVENSSLLPNWPNSCGPPDWNKFLSWLANRAEVVRLVTDKFSTGEQAVFAVVTHGNFLDTVLASHGWIGPHPHNAESFQAELPVSFNGDSIAFHHFGNIASACPGNYPSSGLEGPTIWRMIGAGAIIISMVFCAWRRYHKDTDVPAITESAEAFLRDDMPDRID